MADHGDRVARENRRVVRCAILRLLEQLADVARRRREALARLRFRAEIELDRDLIGRRHALGNVSRERERFGDRARNLVREGERVLALLVEFSRPKLEAVGHVEEAGGDAELLARATNGAVDDDVDTELAPDVDGVAIGSEKLCETRSRADA